MPREYCDYIGEDAELLHWQHSVADIPDKELLHRAVGSARSAAFRRGDKHPRWVAVMERFLLGSTYAAQLCRRFGFDPNEEVRDRQLPR